MRSLLLAIAVGAAIAILTNSPVSGRVAGTPQATATVQ
jgi:hypothetical protein